jgi:hypothetical protein
MGVSSATAAVRPKTPTNAANVTALKWADEKLAADFRIFRSIYIRNLL